MSFNNQYKPGYKHTPLGWIPEEWNALPLGEVALIYDGTHMTPSYTETGVPFYSVEQVTSNNFSQTKFISRDVYEKEVKRVKIEKGDILMTRIGDIGTTRIIDWDVEASFYVSLALIKPKRKFCFRFLNFFIQSSKFKRELYKRIIHVAFPVKINLGEISNCLIVEPKFAEKEEIATILSTWDEAITKTQQLIAQLQQRNKGLMQPLLTAKDNWKEKKMSDVFDRVVRKNTNGNANVITISAQRGFVKQNDFFKKLVASETLDNYFLVRKGEFCYNKSYSNGYDWGATKRLNDFDEAVVTTLYICFRIKNENEYSGEYFEYFFDANILDRGLAKIAHEGGRAHGLLNVTPSDFFRLKIHVPPYDEQLRIFKILSAAKSELKLTEHKLAVLQQQKKGLMHKLLTGEVRVKIDNNQKS